MRRILLTGLFLILGGCTTHYGPESWQGGYTDVQVNTDSFIVGFKGRKPLHTKEMALLRSAEVALEHGFQYFVVAQTDDLSTVRLHTYTINSMSLSLPGTWGYDTRIHTTKHPHYVYTIICFVGKPATPSYSARMIVDNMRRD